MSDAKQKTALSGWGGESIELNGPGPSIAATESWSSRSIFNLAQPWIMPSRTMKRRLWPAWIGFGYVVANFILGGLNSDHLFIGLLSILDFYNEKSRLFLKCFFPFVLTGVIYDSMRYYYWNGVFNRVHVSEPYFRELSWFGLFDASADKIHRVTPNEYFRVHTSLLFDLMCGFAYLVFVAEYLITAFFLFFKNYRELLYRFGLCFLVVNILGFITYFVYPAAPPWYVMQYGLGPARLDVRPTAAAAQRFDVFFGTHFFDHIYGRGIDVYGAYPSLHVAYPFLVVWVVFQCRELRFFRIPSILFYVLMCVSAVYLQHHYVVDILLGTLYAVVTLLSVNRCFRSKGIFAT